MIPVVKVVFGSGMADPAGNSSTNYKKVDTIQRQDSGFISASPTPVTPSTHDINCPPSSSYQHNRDSLPTIPEAMSFQSEESEATRAATDNEQEEDDSEPEQISSIRPARPTTLSPHAPPPLPLREEDRLTPLTPGTVLRHYNENAGRVCDPRFNEYIERRADEIIQQIVPETPTAFNALHLVSSHMPSSSETTPSTPNVVRQSEVAEPPSSIGYPDQVIHHPINKDQLCLGSDGHYYQFRDYDRTDEEILGEGGFGTVYACQDRVKYRLFAIKSNKNGAEDKLVDMKSECGMLREIGGYEYITQYFGSFIDDYGPNNLEGKRFKMLMECATNGNLSELLVDIETNEKLGLLLDQSLYYLQQILFAVNYLHHHAILHLDLKCANILVFNEGRTVKLTDFGSAIRLDQTSDCRIDGCKGCTAFFSAPEVVRSETLSFSADVWSVMCCFIEMLTGELPWCYQRRLEHLNVILLVGNYDESQPSCFDQLLPHQELELPPEVVALFRRVLRRNPKMRPTALDLLDDSLIKDAHEYEKEFDNNTFEECEYVDPASSPLIDTPTKDSATDSLGVVKKSPLMESRTSFDSGNYTEQSSSDTSSPGSACPTAEEDSKMASSFPMNHRVIPNSTFRGSDSGCYSNMYLCSYGQRHHVALTSSSAPPDITGGCWEERDSGRFNGEDDNEIDGPATHRKTVLKRTTSANYVSNGPEVDSPEGRHQNYSFPPTYTKTSSSVFPSNIVTVGMVSVGTQTSLSPTVESKPMLGSQTTFVSYTTTGYR